MAIGIPSPRIPTREGGFVVTRGDITERKRAEAAQLEADALVRQVLEACSVNIQMTRAHDGKLIYRSPATKELLGEVESAVEYYVNPEDREAYVQSLLQTGVVDDFETELRRADGGTCWCSISSRLIEFKGEKVVVSHTYDLDRPHRHAGRTAAAARKSPSKRKAVRAWRTPCRCRP